jgi:hypothetical protein
MNDSSSQPALRLSGYGIPFSGRILADRYNMGGQMTSTSAQGSCASLPLELAKPLLRKAYTRDAYAPLLCRGISSRIAKLVPRLSMQITGDGFAYAKSAKLYFESLPFR